MDTERNRKTEASKTDRVGMMTTNSDEAINKLARFQDLCEELLETLTITLTFIKDYTEEHKIPIPNREKLAYLLRKTSLLLEECRLPQTNFQKTYESQSSDESLQRKKSDKDLTDPYFEHSAAEITNFFRLICACNGAH